jgi:hypothetical protein
MPCPGAACSGHAHRRVRSHAKGQTLREARARACVEIVVTRDVLTWCARVRTTRAAHLACV